MLCALRAAIVACSLIRTAGTTHTVYDAPRPLTIPAPPTVEFRDSRPDGQGADQALVHGRRNRQLPSTEFKAVAAKLWAPSPLPWRQFSAVDISQLPMDTQDMVNGRLLAELDAYGVPFGAIRSIVARPGSNTLTFSVRRVYWAFTATLIHHSFSFEHHGQSFTVAGADDSDGGLGLGLDSPSNRPRGPERGHHDGDEDERGGRRDDDDDEDDDDDDDGGDDGDDDSIKSLGNRDGGTGDGSEASSGFSITGVVVVAVATAMLVFVLAFTAFSYKNRQVDHPHHPHQGRSDYYDYTPPRSSSRHGSHGNHGHGHHRRFDSDDDGSAGTSDRRSTAGYAPSAGGASKVGMMPTFDAQLDDVATATTKRVQVISPFETGNFLMTSPTSVLSAEYAAFSAGSTGQATKAAFCRTFTAGTEAEADELYASCAEVVAGERLQAALETGGEANIYDNVGGTQEQRRRRQRRQQQQPRQQQPRQQQPRQQRQQRASQGDVGVSWPSPSMAHRHAGAVSIQQSQGSRAASKLGEPKPTYDNMVGSREHRRQVSHGPASQGNVGVFRASPSPAINPLSPAYILGSLEALGASKLDEPKPTESFEDCKDSLYLFILFVHPDLSLCLR